MDAAADATGADFAATTEALAPSRRFSNRAASTWLAGDTPASTVLAARFDNLREGAKASVVAAKSSPMASAAASTPQAR